MMQLLEREILKLLGGLGLFPLRAKAWLEVGCGRGFWLRELVKWGAAPESIVGVDLLAESLVEASHRSAQQVRLVRGDVRALPFPTGSFDVVLQATLFTSILAPEARKAAASEMLRVVRPGGVVLWYDFLVDNPRNPRVRGVSRSELRALFAPYQVKGHRVTLAPPLSRWLAARSDLLCTLAAAIPPLRTHYLAAIRKPYSSP
jgi:ubiquinone/menaquinone biosynthesis C-methylase UbiE